MKKVLFVHHAGTIGGASWSLLYTIKALDATRYNAHVLFLEPGKVVELFDKEHISYSVLQNKTSFKCHRKFIHIEPIYAKWYEFIKILRMFMWWYRVSNWYAPKELKLLDYDLIHLNSVTLIDWAKAAKKDGKKVILHVREPLARGLLGMRRIFIRRQIDKYCDRVIAISNDNAKRVGLPNKTSVVYNFSDFSKFDLTVNPLLERENGYFYVLYMGGAKKYKGFELLAKSVQHIDKKVKIILAGTYKRLIKRSPLLTFKRSLDQFFRGVPNFDKLLKDPRIKFVGLSTEVPELIQTCDAVLFPATKTHFPRPLIEGMAMKKMVLAFDIDGIEEVIKHEKNGLIIPKSTAKRLARGINEMAALPVEQQREMANFGYELTRSKFSVQNVQKITNLYDDLTAK